MNATETPLRKYEGTFECISQKWFVIVVIGRTFLKHGENLKINLNVSVTKSTSLTYKYKKCKFAHL